MDRISIDDLFDRRLTFPDPAAQRRFHSLVGIEGPKARLTKLLAVCVNPAGISDWAHRQQYVAPSLLSYVERRPPLAVLAGDVGTGKTELAETVGDAVARQEHISVTLFPLSLASRGSGRVGEMTRLISAAFDETISAAKPLKRASGKAGGGVILLVDEADALAQSREDTQMHHEDRAGVNAFIRGVDRLCEQRLPVAVVLCTNRLGALDPAVRRRAAEVFEFSRPNDAQRRAILQGPLSEVGFTTRDVDRVVAETGPGNGAFGFTYSDLTQRLLPLLVLDAYPDGPISVPRALELLRELSPTPPFSGPPAKR
jgi:AAA+ superfamily predicted ATPase